MSGNSISNPRAVTRISVGKLFGYYTYELPDPSTEDTDFSRLLILYGDNGLGKTTILKLFYHLLSPAPRAGHRTFVARQRFERFAVRLADGTSIAAERTRGSFEGAYEFSIHMADGTQAAICLEPNEEGAIRLKGTEDRELLRILRLISSLNLDLYFLSDDRRTIGVLEEDQDEDYYTLEYPEEKHIRRRLAIERLRQHPGLPLEPVIEKTVDWIRDQTLRGSSVGQASANTIYTDVVKHIARFPRGEEDVSPQQIEDLLETLDDLTERSKVFADLGLTFPLNTEEISNTLERSSLQTRALIYNVIKPYVDGTVARLDALQEIKDLITIFLNNINRFYVQKHVEFALGRGLRIVSQQGQRLDPGILSSGEKQLLLLFCSALAAQEQSSIFIIDEPELSLNVKWQRDLIDALLECVRKSQIQFLLATHSIELLARHKRNVARLTGASTKA